MSQGWYGRAKTLIDADGDVSEITKSGALLVAQGDTPSIDAFGRARVAEPVTLFDSKQLHDAAPLTFDDAEVSGTGTGSSHNVNTASTILSTTNATAGKRVRQTFMRFNYQPGKSQLILCTGTLQLLGAC